MPTCAQAGIVGALPGVMGSMMALEAIKLVAAAGTPFRGALLIYDALHAETRRIRIAPQPACPVCHGAGA
jgi:molybdopterin/thiamine biosynthesis adenylyltransferase